MRSLPDYLRLYVELSVGSLAQACRWAIRATSVEGVPAIVKWAIPAHGRKRARGLEQRLAAIEARTDVPDDPSLAFELADHGGATVYPEGERWVFELELDTSTADATDITRAMALLVTVLRALANDGIVTGAVASWRGPGAQCLPRVPILGERAFAAVTSVGEVGDAYAQPDAFWAACEDIEDMGSKRLVTRALDCGQGPSFLRRVMDSQWALARASKPGGVGLHAPTPTEEEHAIYRRGPRRLQMVGYDAGEGLLEMSCVLGADQHIQGWEIFDLWHPLVTGRTADGRDVKELRVMFLDRDTAEREKRPLLDAGARVFVACDDGEVEVEDT